jgi:putative hydrolase of the HAD superfamily
MDYTSKQEQKSQDRSPAQEAGGQIRAVVFDYGNVVSLPQRPSEVESMASICGLPLDRFYERYWRFRPAYDRGELDGKSYWESVTDGQGPSLARVEVDRLMAVDGASWAHPNERTLEWVRQFKGKGLGLALLSNMPFAVSDYLEENCGWLAVFDYRLYSCAFGCAKPEVPIYAACLDTLKLAPQEVLFFDDRPENVQAASELGIHSLVFDTVEHTAARVRSQFGLPSP